MLTVLGADDGWRAGLRGRTSTWGVYCSAEGSWDLPGAHHCPPWWAVEVRTVVQWMDRRTKVLARRYKPNKWFLSFFCKRLGRQSAVRWEAVPCGQVRHSKVSPTDRCPGTWQNQVTDLPGHRSLCSVSTSRLVHKSGTAYRTIRLLLSRLRRLKQNPSPLLFPGH